MHVSAAATASTKHQGQGPDPPRLFEHTVPSSRRV